MEHEISEEEIEGYIILIEDVLKTLKKIILNICGDEKSEYLSMIEELETNLDRLKNQ